LKAAWEKTGQPLDAANADLRPFKARGGKLILYHDGTMRRFRRWRRSTITTA